MTSAPTAVVFDCDGVLVDSEPHSVAAWLEVLAGLGHPAMAADIERCTGLGFGATRVALDRLAPLPDASKLWPALMTALADSFGQGLMVFEDAAAVLEAVEAAGIPVAVASASPRQRLDLTLVAAGLAGRFGVSVAGDEVSHPKPDPAVYRAAIQRLGVEPTGAVAIEDTATGVAAAHGAGLAVIAVDRTGTGLSSMAEAGATVVEGLTPALVGL